LLGIFYKRINGLAAFVTLIVGLIASVFGIVLELQKDNLDSNGFLIKVGNVNFLTFGTWFFLFCILLVKAC